LIPPILREYIQRNGMEYGVPFHPFPVEKLPNKGMVSSHHSNPPKIPSSKQAIDENLLTLMK
jgi:hypothetical protein